MKCSRTIIALGAVAILLIGSGNACLAQTQQPPPPPKRFQMLFPVRYKCLDLLELERIKVNPQTDTITVTDPNDAIDYYAVAGWLRGFFTAWNLTMRPDGDLTKETKTHQMMAWTFSYCRAHPSENLFGAAAEFVNAMSKAKK